MNSLNQYIELFEQYRSRIDAASAPAINSRRDEALEILRAASLPTRGAEGYVVVAPDEMFAPDYGVNIDRLEASADVAHAFRCDVPNLSTLLGVVVNDSFHPTSTLDARLPQGVTFCSLRQLALDEPDFVRRHYLSAAPVSNPTVALNALLLQDGVVIRVARGVKVEKPLQLVNIFNAAMPLMAVRHLIIVAEEDAEVAVLACDHTQTTGISFLSSDVVEVIVGPRARVDFYDVESSTDRTSRAHSLWVSQQEQSTFNSGIFTLRCGVTRNEVNIDILQPRCSTFVGGLAIASSTQHFEYNWQVNHSAPRCHSLQLFKTVLDDQSRGAFEGRILVEQGAAFTEAYQSNRNMLASPEARVHTEPQLEIYCDEVKCSHGATTGQINEDQLFYMRTRGIPEAEARTMLMQAFMSDVIDAVKLESLRDRLHHLVEQRFVGSGSACGDCIAKCNK